MPIQPFINISSTGNSVSPILLGDIFWSTSKESTPGKLYAGDSYSWSSNPKLKLLFDSEGHDFIIDNGTTFTVLEYTGFIRGKATSQNIGSFGNDVVTSEIANSGNEETRVAYFGIYGDASVVAVDTNLASKGDLGLPSNNEFASTLEISNVIDTLQSSIDNLGSNDFNDFSATFDNIDTLLTSTETYSPGDLIQVLEREIVYEAEESNATLFHIENAAGQKFSVIPNRSKEIYCTSLGAVENTDCATPLTRFLNHPNGATTLVIDGSFWLSGDLYNIPSTVKSFIADNYNSLSHGESATRGFEKMDFIDETASQNGLPTRSNQVFNAPSGFSVRGLRLAHNVTVDITTVANGGNYTGWFNCESQDIGLEMSRCRFDHEGGTGARIISSPYWRFIDNYCGLQKWLLVIAEGSSYGLYEGNRGKMGFQGLGGNNNVQIHGDYIKVLASNTVNGYCIIRKNQFINDFRDGPDGTGGFFSWTFTENYFEVDVAALDLKTSYRTTNDLLHDKRNEGIIISNNIFYGCGTTHTLLWDTNVAGPVDQELGPKNITYIGNIYIPKPGKNLVAHHIKGCQGFTSIGEVFIATPVDSGGIDGYIGCAPIRADSGNLSGVIPSNIIFRDTVWDSRGAQSVILSECTNLYFNFAKLTTSRESLSFECSNVEISGNIFAVERPGGGGSVDVFGLRLGADNIRFNCNLIHSDSGSRGSLSRVNGTVGTVYIDGIVDGPRELLDVAGTGSIEELYLGQKGGLEVKNLNFVLNNQGVVSNVFVGEMTTNEITLFNSSEPLNHNLGSLRRKKGLDLDINSNQITVSHNQHRLIPASNGNTLQLDTINGGAGCDHLVLTLANNSGDVTISNGLGNIFLQSTRTLSNIGNVLVLEKRADNNWHELRYSI